MKTSTDTSLFEVFWVRRKFAWLPKKVTHLLLHPFKLEKTIWLSFYLEVVTRDTIHQLIFSNQLMGLKLDKVIGTDEALESWGIKHLRPMAK